MKLNLSGLVIVSLLVGLTKFVNADPYTYSFARAKGTQIVDESGDVLYLKGISFGNRVWSGDRIPTSHHSAQDYLRVRAMGMNLVRFYINYKTLESDDKPYSYRDDGWQWLDKNVEWARAAGVYLIFNLHIPQGGFQSQGRGWDLWQKPELQSRAIALWRAIASRYENEPVILGYDLLNEPGVPQNKKQWQQLAQKKGERDSQS